MEDVKHKAVRGGLAKLIGQAVTFTVRFSYLVIVVRLLDPADFGLVAMVTAVTGVYDLFRDGGLSAAAVQQASITEEQKSTLFWVNMLVGFVLCLICLLTAPALVYFYNEPRLLWITVALSAGFIFSAAGAQHKAILERELRYVALSVIDALSLTASTALAIAAAFVGFGYWALVISAVVLPIISTTALWGTTRWMPGLPSRNANIASMLHFGGTITMNIFVSYVTNNLDKVLLGRFWGADALGLYGRASQVIHIPMAQLNVAFGSVAFSALSRVRHDSAKFKSYFLKGYTLLITMTTPITLFSAVFAEDITRVVLGPKWMDVAAIFRLLSPTVLIFGIIDPMSWLMWSTGQHRRSLAIAFAIAPLCIGAYLVGLPHGPQGVALAYSTAMALWVIPHLLWCLKGSVVSLWELFRTMGPPVFSAVVAVAAAFGAGEYVHIETPLWRLLFVGVVMGSTYGLMLLFVMGQKEFYLSLLSLLRSPRAAPQGSE